MKVIALRGIENCGKSTTLNIVYNLLLDDGYLQVPNHFEELGNPIMRDFIDVLVKDGILLGIVTMGDYARKRGSSVKDLLKKLETKGCIIAICACRNDKTGTVKAVQEYQKHQFVDKVNNKDKSLQRIINHKDARTITGLI
ncbi:hypothetical protein [Aquimarina macrocephali]|uniref:hypothetical protein n=1 Tax=Aquimarina macrocephali TaxID=666563 RepID=UPI00046799B4|nr:hypothetical protein [Aquimarina macrocephali]